MPVLIILRRLAREAVIFTLLGPIPVFIFLVGADIRHAPRPTPYTIARSFQGGYGAKSPLWHLFITTNTDLDSLKSAPYIDGVGHCAPPPSKPQASHKGKSGPWSYLGPAETIPPNCSIILDEDKIYPGVHDILFNDDLYIQAENGEWLKFADFGASDGITPHLKALADSASLERAVNGTPLRDYVHLETDTIIALIWAWPFGFAIWLAYRIVKFAIQG